MYLIQNIVSKETISFSKVKDAVKYMKALKKDYTKPTRDEIIDLCNIFAKYKNKIAINGIS